MHNCQGCCCPTLVNMPDDNVKRQLFQSRLCDKQCVSNNCAVCPNGRLGIAQRSGFIKLLLSLQRKVYRGNEKGSGNKKKEKNVKEHLANKRPGLPSSPLREHRIDVHNVKDFEVKCSTLAVEEEIAARKSLEEF